MNEFISSMILAVVQGITEWLPISSSGHLVLFERFLNFSGGLDFDVAVHFGSLIAVFVYFGKDITDIIESFLRWQYKSESFRLGVFIIIGSIPSGIAGIFFRKYFESAFESLLLVALGFAITGIFLLIASINITGKSGRFGYPGAFLTGLSEAIAIFPGISRSGATISSGVLLGLSPKNAGKFSFLLAVPAIFGASILEIGNKKIPLEMLWAVLISFVVSLIAMHFLFRLVLTSRKNLRWFGIYTLILAVVILLYTGFF